MLQVWLYKLFNLSLAVYSFSSSYNREEIIQLPNSLSSLFPPQWESNFSLSACVRARLYISQRLCIRNRVCVCVCDRALIFKAGICFCEPVRMCLCCLHGCMLIYKCVTPWVSACIAKRSLISNRWQVAAINKVLIGPGWQYCWQREIRGKNHA